MVLPSSPATSKWMASESPGLLSCRSGFHALALFYSSSVLPLCTSSSLALLDHPSSPTVGRGSVSVCIYFFFSSVTWRRSLSGNTLDLGVEFIRNIVCKRL